MFLEKRALQGLLGVVKLSDSAVRVMPVFLMWVQYGGTDGAEGEKATFFSSHVALLMRSLKNQCITSCLLCWY